jgi:hypothetical protein
MAVPPTPVKLSAKAGDGRAALNKTAVSFKVLNMLISTFEVSNSWRCGPPFGDRGARRLWDDTVPADHDRLRPLAVHFEGVLWRLRESRRETPMVRSSAFRTPA